MQCRICFGEDSDKYVLPCKCSGSMKWVHQSCLDAWIQTCSDLAKVECPTCKTNYTGCSKPKTALLDARELCGINRERKMKIIRNIMMHLEEH